MSEEEPDLAARQADIAAAMEETQRRQEQLQKRQDALLAELKKLDRAMDRDKPGND
jgi:Skp family chaperone for outer membrane proteins